MEEPAIPTTETARLQALDRYDILDTPAEEVFDRITRIASLVTGAPTALVSLVDRNRQWFKSRVGLEAAETGREVSFCGHAILSSEPLVVPDATQDSRFADNPLVQAEPSIRFYMGVPLTVSGGQNVGTLCVIDRTPRELDAKQERILEELALMVVRELEVRKAAATDPLTGALNRRMRDHMLVRAMEHARHRDQAFSLAMLDFDRFKRINDWYGHDAGDNALLRCAAAMSDSLEAEDTLFRFGGDRFSILYADSGAAQAAARLERLRADIAALELPGGDQPFSVTVSAGLATFDPAAPESAAALVRRAENALHAAKEAGRDRSLQAKPDPA